MLYAKAQKRLPLIVARVRRERRIASPAASRSPLTRVRSLASIATSGAGADREAEVGLGERRSVVDAVADHRHDAPVALQALDDGRLLGRQHLGDHLVDPDRGRRRRAAVCSLSPVRSTGRRPRRFSSAIASALDGLTVSATTKTARATPSQAAAIAVWPCSCGERECRVELGRQLEPPLARAAPAVRRRRRGPRRRLRRRGRRGCGTLETCEWAARGPPRSRSPGRSDARTRARASRRGAAPRRARVPRR